MRIHQLPPWHRRTVSGVLLAVAVLVALGGVVDGGRPEVVALAGVAVLVALAVRSHQLRVETGADVVVVNWLHTHRFAWDQVERFAVAGGGVELRLAGGRRVPVRAFPAVTAVTRTAQLRLDLAAEALERARRRHRDDARPGAAGPG